MKLFEINTTNSALVIELSNNDYYIGIRNNQFAPVSAHIKLTKDEFKHIAQEMYKLWKPSNIVEALDKLK